MVTYTPDEMTRMATAALIAASNTMGKATEHAVLTRAEKYLEWLKNKPL
jgi:hypothetical protein